MKVSLNSQFYDGPYGGGMQFANFIRDFLTDHDVEVVNHLNHPDIDIILHINPFPFLTSASAYSFLDAYQYKLNHPSIKIIQRINECDQRKDTHYLNQLLTIASQYADHVVFIASWLKPLLEPYGFNTPSSVILNGGDPEIFNTKHHSPWNKKSRLKLVTHHWGADYRKGHDIYQQLDRLLNQPEYSQRYEFTYIGNYPKYLKYTNTTILKPLSGKELSKQLQKHHVYLTASQFEPAGMHHIEGALCGLPLLYRNSGALPEYCHGYGIQFDTDNFVQKLDQIHRQYTKWYDKLQQYPYTAEHMGKKYLRLITQIAKESHPPLHSTSTIAMVQAYLPLLYRLRARFNI